MTNDSSFFLVPGTLSPPPVSNPPSKLPRPEGTGNPRRNSMFNNLIESSSHLQEFKRRGSFLLLTTATYLVLFVITGVVSIYAYDAHLESQSTEWEITFMPVPPPDPAPPEIRNTIRPAATTETPSTARSVRTDLYDDISNPNNPPVNVSTAPHNIPPARSDSVRGNFNADPITPAGSTGVPGGTGNTPVVTMVDPPPPPPPPPPVVPKVLNVSKGVLAGKAISLPRPGYPVIARPIRLQGTVSVQILIDESGKVVSAKAVSGHPIFVPEAIKAAMQARFSPTMLSEQPVKVSGVITYNFVMK
jgi:periplasmic protein TonB